MSFVYVALPAYNEELGIEKLIKNLELYFRQRIHSYKIVVCNDGSNDKTAEILSNLKLKNDNILVIEHKINRGLGEAMRTIFEFIAETASENDLVVRMDADGTHEPQYIDSLIAKITEGYDVVIASRFCEGGAQIGVPTHRIILSKIANIFLKILFFRKNAFKEVTCGYRAYKVEIIKKAIDVFKNEFIQLRGFGFACTVEKLIKLNLIGARIAEIPFELRYDMKQSNSKMIASITTYGYLIMIWLFFWPQSGWKATYGNFKH